MSTASLIDVSNHDDSSSRHKSVGRCIGTIGNLGHRCWEAEASVRLEFHNNVRPRILQHLDGLFGSVCTRDAITVTLYMIGRRMSTAVPTVLFVSENETNRKRARKLIKETGILRQHPGWKTAQASMDPAWGARLEQLASGSDTIRYNHTSEPARKVLYDPMQPVQQQGMTLYVLHEAGLRAMTANLYRHNDRAYFLAPAHAFFDSRITALEELNISENDFEIDSDNETLSIPVADPIVEYPLVEPGYYESDTRRCSYASRDSETFSMDSDNETCSQYSSSSSGTVRDGEIPLQTHVNYRSPSMELHRPSDSELAPFGVLSCWSIDKDWALVAVHSEGNPLLSAFLAAAKRDLSTACIASHCHAGAAVVTHTASSGKLEGVMSSTPTDICLPLGKYFQEVFSIRLDGSLAEGDCGSAVFDATTGEFYGHIVAGCRQTGFAYVMAAHHFMRDIHTRIATNSKMLPSFKSSKVDGLARSEQQSQSTESSSMSHSQVRSQPQPQIRKTSTGLGSRGSKAWPQVFSQRHPVSDHPFVDTVRRKGPGVDFLSAFLQDTDASGPSWEVEQARCFCLEAPDMPEAKIWVDDRTSYDKKHNSPKWMTSPIYCRSPPRHPNAYADGCIHRRLTFVPNLTPNIIKALVETSSWYEAQTLRPAVRQHIAGETSIRVYIPMAGFRIFRLSMHLPYLLLKKSIDERMIDEQGNKLWDDLSFLPFPDRWSIYEAQTTVIISGANHYDWHGYAFGNPGPKDAYFEEYSKERDNASDSEEEEEDDDDGDGPDFFEEEEDVFATGGCEPVTNPSNVIWDPRVYFLRTLQIRLAVVVQANEYLVQKLAAGVRLWKIQEREKEAPVSVIDPQAQDKRLRRALEGVSNMTDLFQLLRERFSQANTVWEKFNGKRGDVLYFADLEDAGADRALYEIEESFERMKNLELTLARLQHTCELSANLLALQLSHQGHEMSRKMIFSHEQVILLTAKAVESAAKSLKTEEDTSRATRVNIHLLVVTTAIVIALLYFGSERALFSFERSPRAFWISISVLVPGLMILTLALHALDEVKEVFTSRVTGKLKQAATPTILPDSPA